MVVGLGEGDGAFDADAILAGRLEHAAHEDTRDLCLQTLDIIEDYSGVFAAEFDEHGGQGLSGGGTDIMGDQAGADEGDVGDARVGGQVVCGGWPADDGLDELGGVAA